MWNNPISHRLISLLSDVNNPHDVIIMWKTHELQMHAMGNFHRRDLKFSDIVPDTIPIFNYNKKNDKNLIATNTVSLTLSLLEKKIIWNNWRVSSVSCRSNAFLLA